MELIVYLNVSQRYVLKITAMAIKMPKIEILRSQLDLSFGLRRISKIKISERDSDQEILFFNITRGWRR